MNGDAQIRIDVLDRGYVELLETLPAEKHHTYPTGEMVSNLDLHVVRAARASYADQLKGINDDLKLLRYLMRKNHTSPFEQVEFQFRVHAPVVVWWHLVRHRMSELNMQSGRYTEYPEDEFYLPAPDQWRLQDAENRQGSSGFLDAGDAEGDDWYVKYCGGWFTRQLQMMQEQGYRLYQSAIAAGIAREQARLFLQGWTSYHTGIWKLNAHSLMNLINLRADSHAQAETERYGSAFAAVFQTTMPATSQAFNTRRRRVERAQNTAAFWERQYIDLSRDYQTMSNRQFEFNAAPLLARVWHAIRKAL